MKAVTMTSCKLPSLVSLNGFKLSSPRASSCFFFSSFPSRNLRTTRGVEKSGQVFRCYFEAHGEKSAFLSSDPDTGMPQSPSSVAFQCSERGNVEPRLGQDDKDTSTSCGAELSLFSVAPMLIVPAIADGAGYSQASYYTSLGLFIISVPGVWSLIKRSTKSKIVRKTFVVPGPGAENGKTPSRLAGEITSSLTRNNFSVTDRGEVVTFEGIMVPSRGQAAFLSFCTAISLGCVALVLTITSPEVGSNWYYLTLLSPLAGLYYWTRASRKEEIKVKMVVADDEISTDVTLQGDDEQIDRLRRELELMEKGMVYVKGIFEQD